jgi:hypothetical protein
VIASEDVAWPQILPFREGRYEILDLGADYTWAAQYWRQSVIGIKLSTDTDLGILPKCILVLLINLTCSSDHSHDYCYRKLLSFKFVNNKSG